jgi:hypothetical protein
VLCSFLNDFFFFFFGAVLCSFVLVSCAVLCSFLNEPHSLNFCAVLCSFLSEPHYLSTLKQSSSCF